MAGHELAARLPEQEDVQKVMTHICQFGTTWRTGGIGSEVGPVLKSTGFVTDRTYLVTELNKNAREIIYMYTASVRLLQAQAYLPQFCAAPSARASLPRSSMTRPGS